MSTQREWLRRCKFSAAALLAAVFVYASTAASAHEYEHIFDEHNEPCAQHVLADNVAKAPAPLIRAWDPSAANESAVSRKAVQFVTGAPQRQTARGPPLRSPFLRKL
jgi:hypothetical protein